MSSLSSRALRLIRRWWRPPDPTTRLVILRKSMVLLAISLVLSTVDVLNVQDHFRELSSDIFYRVSAPLYPAPKVKPVSVVLLDDTTLGTWDTFPARYGTHAQILAAILARAPKAVFVDFTFIDARPDDTLDQLVAVIRAYHDAGVPLYLPALSNNGRIVLRPELARLAEEGAVTLVSPEFGRFLLGHSVYRAATPPGGLDTAAARIFRDLRPTEASRIDGLDEFEIWWGLPPDPLNCLALRTLCDARRGTLWSQLAEVAQIEVLGLSFSGARNTDGVPVPFTPYVSAHRILDGNDEAFIGQVLSDKIVMYGSFLRLLEDYHPNPVFSFGTTRRDIPGVFVHAMALENLLDLHGVVKAARPTDGLSLWLRDALTIIVLVVCLTGLRLWFKRERLRLEPLVNFGIVGVIAFVEFHFLNIGPSSWAGVFAYVTLSEEGLERHVDGLLVRAYRRWTDVPEQ